MTRDSPVLAALGSRPPKVSPPTEFLEHKRNVKRKLAAVGLSATRRRPAPGALLMHGICLWMAFSAICQTAFTLNIQTVKHDEP